MFDVKRNKYQRSKRPAPTRRGSINLRMLGLLSPTGAMHGCKILKFALPSTVRLQKPLRGDAAVVPFPRCVSAEWQCCDAVLAVSCRISIKLTLSACVESYQPDTIEADTTTCSGAVIDPLLRDARDFPVVGILPSIANCTYLSISSPPVEAGGLKSTLRVLPSTASRVTFVGGSLGCGRGMAYGVSDTAGGPDTENACHG